ncbi:MAG: hypothetical protein AAFO94_18410, partial [Bacteroidota bacterium]
MKLEDQILDSGFQPQSFDEQTVKKINLLKLEINHEIDHVRKGSYAIIGLIVLTIVGILISLNLNPYDVGETAILLEGGITLCIYIACAIFYKRSTLAALGTALGTYILIQLLSAIADPSLLVK